MKNITYNDIINDFDFLDLSGIQCNKGWFRIIYECLEKIEKADPDKDFYIVSIGENKGHLQFYYSYTYNGDSESLRNSFLDKVDAYIKEAEEKSKHTCEFCGQEGYPRKEPWIRVTCNDCEESHFGDADSRETQWW